MNVISSSVTDAPAVLSLRSFANKALTLSEAEQRRTNGFQELETLFLRGSKAVDDLKEARLRAFR